jgi:hypothetical protein
MNFFVSDEDYHMARVRKEYNLKIIDLIEFAEKMTPAPDAFFFDRLSCLPGEEV